MPTYRNDGSTNYLLGGGLALRPGQVIESTRLLDHLDGVTRVADAPAYNPALARHAVALEAGAVAVDLAHPLEITRVLVLGPTVPVDVYLNHPENAPALPVAAGESLEIETRQSVERLLIVAAAPGSVTVLEVTDGN